MTTIHRNKNAFGVPMLVGPPGKCPLGPCVERALRYRVLFNVGDHRCVGPGVNIQMSYLSERDVAL